MTTFSFIVVNDTSKRNEGNACTIVHDMIFVKKIPRPQFLRGERGEVDICSFTTKVRKWFEMVLNQ